MGSLGFEELADRLVRYLNELVRRGEVSERGLAKLSGYSQPHIHNVLHRVRALKISTADRLLETLGIPLTALFTQDELAGRAERSPSQGQPVALLQGPLGAGAPFPREMQRPTIQFLPGQTLEGLVNPVLAKLSPEERSAWPTLWPQDLLLLDRSPQRRKTPTLDWFYALEWQGGSYVCRCRRMGSTLLTITEHEGSVEPPARIPAEPGELLSIVRGVVVWVSRDLRRS